MKFKIYFYNKSKSKIGKEKCYVGAKGNIEEYAEYYKHLEDVKKIKIRA